jgi:hypothetical protein
VEIFEKYISVWNEIVGGNTDCMSND